MGYRIGIVGPEASGKTKLAQQLANRFAGVYIEEYARTYVMRKGSLDVSYDELCSIAKHQIEEMKNLTAKRSYSDSGLTAERSNSAAVFFDTELLVTKVWFSYAFHRVPEWLDQAISAYPMDLYLLTYPDLPWVQDGARYNGSDAIRLELFDRYRQEIEALGIPYYIIRH